jgi:hypothetical protein
MSAARNRFYGKDRRNIAGNSIALKENGQQGPPFVEEVSTPSYVHS